MKKEKGKGLAIVLILSIIIILTLIGYICYDKGLFINNNKTNNEVNSDSVKSDDSETNTKDDSYHSLAIDNSKCLTDCTDLIYRLGASAAGDGIEVGIAIDDNTKIYVNINKRLLENEYAYEFNSNDDMYTFDFDKKIQDLFVGHIGQDPSMPMLFVLLEDGSVEDIDLYSKITTGDAKQIKLTNVKDVIKFYQASVREKNSEYGGIYTVLAQTSNGSFYDLDVIIHEKQ